MIPIKLSQKTTPFSCKEHVSSSKNEEITRFLRFLNKIYQTLVNKSREAIFNQSITKTLLSVLLLTSLLTMPYPVLGMT